ncbi:hypothetical protein [Fusibacter ferrireducens]|uniref:XRE family transcriptional regulator n=1 Tax=Fusibacter ferrireducens TaxID=2785058 RepID=A0ABS0A0W4_9FIRM|nr:hypothetical protein [Fusibacter ferrireducens]MBF4696093.1 hypothetical protein [Fusibacter ferrireducens]
MQIIKNCKTCEFNFDQICSGGGNLLDYGEKISEELEDTCVCSGWGASLEYYGEMIDKAPWYIKDYYRNSKIKYDEFLDKMEKDYKSIGFEVNLYDAIEHVYEINLLELADILGVTFGVVRHARGKGTASKRVTEFSSKLCIPTEYFDSFLSTDLDNLKECSRKFYSIKKPKIKNGNKRGRSTM